MHPSTKKHVRLETILWRQKQQKLLNNNNYNYEPCVVQKVNQLPFFGYILLTADSLRIVNWTVQNKNIQVLADLHRILQIQTISDVPAFILYGVYAENSPHIRILHSISNEQVETIELAFLQKSSSFPKLLQKIWLNRLAECATGVRTASMDKGQLHLLDVYSGYEYFHRLIISEKDESRERKSVLKMAQKMKEWLGENEEFRRLLWKDSLVFDWLLRTIKKEIESYDTNDDRKTLNELLKCLHSFVDIGIIADENHCGLLRTKLSTIVDDILYQLISKEEYFLKCCVDILFTLSLTVIDVTQRDSHVLQSCNTSILLLNVGPSVAALLQLMKLVLSIMGYCVAFLKQEQLRPLEAIVVFKALYAIERLAENNDLKNLMQVEFQDEFKYFNLSIQLSDEFEMPFKKHLITLLNRFKNQFFNKFN